MLDYRYFPKIMSSLFNLIDIFDEEGVITTNFKRRLVALRNDFLNIERTHGHSLRVTNVLLKLNALINLISATEELRD